MASEPVSGSPVLAVSHLKKTLGTTQAVRDISFTLGQGEFVTLLGPSGCGKSTTLRLVRGLERADAGEIAYDGAVVDSKARNVFVAPQKRDIGIVFQSYALWPHMSVYDNVAYPLQLRHAKDIRKSVQSILEMVGLESVIDRSAALLSGGQQQRVALARALVFRPNLLLLDEPFSNLDAQLRERVRVEVRRIQRELGTTVLFVTHDQVEALSLSDRVLMVNLGHIVQDGRPEELYDQPVNRLVRDFVGRNMVIKGRVPASRNGHSAVEVGNGPVVQVIV